MPDGGSWRKRLSQTEAQLTSALYGIMISNISVSGDTNIVKTRDLQKSKATKKLLACQKPRIQTETMKYWHILFWHCMGDINSKFGMILGKVFVLLRTSSSLG